MRLLADTYDIDLNVTYNPTDPPLLMCAPDAATTQMLLDLGADVNGGFTNVILLLRRDTPLIRAT